MTLSEDEPAVSKRSRLLGIFVVLLAVFSVAQGSYYTYETEKKSACQAHFNDDFARVATSRAQWADEDKTAQNNMLNNILAEPSAASRHQILQRYVDATERTDKLRRENPLPSLSERNC